MKRMIPFLLAALLLLPCAAFAAPEKPFYLGAGGLYAVESFDIKDADSLKAYGFGEMSFDNTWGLNAFAGYRFNDNFALEFDFAYVPDFEWSESVVVLTVPVTVEEKVTLMTYALEAKLTIPAGSGFVPYLEAGAGYMDGDLKATVRNDQTGASMEVKDSDSDWFVKFGLGCEKYFGESFSLRLEGGYNMGLNDMDEVRYFTVGLGAGVHF